MSLRPQIKFLSAIKEQHKKLTNFEISDVKPYDEEKEGRNIPEKIKPISCIKVSGTTTDMDLEESEECMYDRQMTIECDRWFEDCVEGYDNYTPPWNRERQTLWRLFSNSPLSFDDNYKYNVSDNDEYEVNISY
jgi:hypothetical protein